MIKSVLKYGGLYVFISISLGCGSQPDDTKENSQSDSTPIQKPSAETSSITVGEFTSFPPEIDGCACYFSSDSVNFKQHKYLYANNYSKISFMKINGVLIKFEQTENKQTNDSTTFSSYKNDLYQLTIETIDGKQNGDETWLKKGFIRLTDQQNNQLNLPFFGECGC